MTLLPDPSEALSAKPMENGYVALVAGEPSGDLLASSVIKALNQNGAFPWPIHGIGGQHMQDAGMKSMWPMDALTVRGYVEALSHLPAILKIRHELINHLKMNQPKVYVGIDAPDFNLGVEKAVKNLGVPTIHFISPSIWAWRKERLKKIEAAVDHMLCLFPFEPELYANTRVHAKYVGHPLASSIPMAGNKEQARMRLGLKRDVTTIAILPGSRASEIKHIAPTFFKAATLMHAYLNGAVQFVVPIATDSLYAPLNQLKIETLNQCPEIDLQLINGQASSCLEASDSVLIASGTATLEAALWKKPMVISYKVPAITAWIMKRQGYLPYIGLPNILCQKFVVPEILQNDATPQNLAKATLNWLDNPQAVANLESQFIELHHRLRLPTGDLVAQTIQEVIRV